MRRMTDDMEDGSFEKEIAEAIALAEKVLAENNKSGDMHTPETPYQKEKPPGNSIDAAGIDRTPDREDNTGASHRNVWRIVFVCSAVVCICCAFLIVRYVIGHVRSQKVNRKLQSMVTTESTGTETEADTEKAVTDPDYPDLQVDFTALRSVNKDICAWLYIPGTDVNYPVMQGGDNSYYLSHDADGNYSPDGSLFVDSANSKEFTDFDTVIYGHNMSSGTMFKTLHNYEDDSFWEKNRNIYVYLPGKVLTYHVFAAYRTNDRHIFTYNDFSDKEVRKRYLDGIFDKEFDTGTVKNDDKVDIDSHVLTLSTCCGMDGKRWLVQAVKVSSDSIGR